jgi:hypothetical protein
MKILNNYDINHRQPPPFRSNNSNRINPSHLISVPTGGSQYTPGIVTDLIREVRDAGRVRDESLMNRVKALIEEKSWSHNETNMRVLRELEEVKVRHYKSRSKELLIE